MCVCVCVTDFLLLSVAQPHYISADSETTEGKTSWTL